MAELTGGSVPGVKDIMKRSLQTGSYSGDRKAIEKFVGVEPTRRPGELMQTPIDAYATPGTSAEEEARRRRLRQGLSILGAGENEDPLGGG